MHELVINNTEIRFDDFGRYCLTDLWKAGGSIETKHPSKFEKTDQCKQLVIIASTFYVDFKPFDKTRGRYNGGTWAVKEISLSYLFYLSPLIQFDFLNETDINERVKLIESSFDVIKKEKLESVATKMEHGSLCAIEQLLGITLERQYRVGKYRIDGYHSESNTAYEIDESYHLKMQQEDAERQVYIKSKLGCKFVRIKV